MTNNFTQCDFCAFKLTEDQSKAAYTRLIENKYRTLREAKKAPKKTRNIFVGSSDDKTETCFIDSPMWEKRKDNIHCPDRLDNSLSLETALDLREARMANRTALNAKIWAIIATIIAIIAMILPYIIPPPK
jgi:hypothetical protein